VEAKAALSDGQQMRAEQQMRNEQKNWDPKGKGTEEIPDPVDDTYDEEHA
jgi:hypothetical protein